MKLSELNKIPNSDFMNVRAEIIKAYLGNKESVRICESNMDEDYADKIREDGYEVVYNQYEFLYEISGWKTDMWSDER